MKLTTLIGTGALLLASSMSWAGDCSAPTAPALPDGAVADKSAMLDGQKAVKSFVAESEALLACLTTEAEALGDGDEVKDAKIALLDQYNEAVDAMTAVADAFNGEIREWKAKLAAE